ncbi:DUF2280 domain-containing protein [Xylophilus rhododendri]|uniref:DUF2280 domain-containing protein n=1 Tax=Xylophilus rhododendri TaxID=2697032 RepID=UPI001E33B99C|nr:DUF2280 domain-containing protein [Xylophilus rhododendri]
MKQFIVQALACYDTPMQVTEAVNLEFGLTVPRQQVEKYDPTKMAGRGLSRKWRDLFQQTRIDWKAGATEVPIANRTFRLRVLARLAQKAEGMRNMALTLQVLEQAAKEVGDAYVNRRLDAPKGPSAEDKTPAQDYKLLRPDEDAPASPIL